MIGAVMALVVAAGAATTPIPPKPSYALMQLFRNLDERITSDTCDSSTTSYKGKRVGELLSTWIDSKPTVTDPASKLVPDRKFSIYCDEGNVLVKGHYQEAWVCSLWVEQNKEDIGGELHWYLRKDTKGYLRGVFRCHEQSDPPVPPEGPSPPKKKR